MSESYPHLEGGVIKDFREIMIDRNYWKDNRWNSTKHTYEFETGSILKFISIDKLGKAHGPRRNVLFINEANNIPYAIYDQLEIRTNEIVWLDWNPTNEFWYYTEIKDKIDHDFITLTYKDCLDALDQRIVQSIESHRDNKNWWRVYGEGQLGEVEGKIYKDWEIIDEIPHEARLEVYGLDYGYSNDPTAIVAIYYLNGGYIFDEITFQKGLSNKQIADIIQNNPVAPVIPDSAEPKSNDELKMYGLTVIPANKGIGSVSHGIQYVQSQRCSVTKRSINIIKEYRNYMWLQDSSGSFSKNSEPDHIWSHSMDAIRYGLSSIELRNRPAEELRGAIIINRQNRLKNELL